MTSLKKEFAVNAKRGRGSGPGWSLFSSAKRCEISWAKFKRACELGQVNYVEFGDDKRCTDAEIARIRQLHGLSPNPDYDEADTENGVENAA